MESYALKYGPTGAGIQYEYRYNRSSYGTRTDMTSELLSMYEGSMVWAGQHGTRQI